MAEFVRRRTQDRVGLVIFGGKSLTKAPPTTDTAVLLRQLEDVKLHQLPDGTAIGSGLATSLTRLRHSTARSKVIVLVTDGANNAGEIDPGTATDLARAMEIRVYTVGVGKGGKVPMPIQVRDPASGQVIKRTLNIPVAIDEGLLKRIAAQTGGEFFRATDPNSLRTIFERIDRLEKSEIKISSYRHTELLSPVLALAGLLLRAGLLWLSGLRVAGMSFASPPGSRPLALPLLALAEAWATRRDRERTARLVARPLCPGSWSSRVGCGGRSHNAAHRGPVA